MNVLGALVVVAVISLAKSDTCGNGRNICAKENVCINSTKFCDGNKDCRDGSDEPHRNISNEDSNNTICRVQGDGGYICILPDYLMPQKESICRANYSCLHDEFSCVDGTRCINKTQFCDAKEDCDDKSDEPYRNKKNEREGDPTKTFCRSRGEDGHICVMPEYLVPEKESLCNENSSCLSDEFNCTDGSRCIKKTSFCDIHEDCRDGSDETYRNKNIEKDKEFDDRTVCRSKGRNKDICILPKSYLSEKDSICHENSSCPNNEFTCDDGSKCIEKGLFCDGRPACRDGSDERTGDPSVLIEGRVCTGKDSSGLLCELPKSFICDGTAICFDEIDECLCGEDDKHFMDTKCFRCLSNPAYVLPIEKFCDGKFDCPDLTDECMCTPNIRPDICASLYFGETDLGMPVACKSKNGELKALKVPMMCNSINECKDDVDEKYCNDTGAANTTKKEKKADYWCPGQCAVYATQCDGKLECEKFGEEECSKKCDKKTNESSHFCKKLILSNPPENDYPKCRKGGKIEPVSPTQICNGEKFCDNFEDESGCENRFYCTSGKEMPNIPKWRVCDRTDNCVNGSDEKNCSHFECEDNGELKYIASTSKCDQIKDCQSGSDECLNECYTSDFSDGSKMISSTPITALVWIISLLAIIGCSSVIVTTTWGLATMQPSPYSFAASDHTKLIKRQILCLSLSDFLVGVYTLAICIESQLLVGCYAATSRVWRGSFSCSALGFLVTLGSEQSVFTMVLIAIQRLRAVMKPFSKPNLFRETTLLLMSWILAMIMSLIPLLPRFEDYFVTSIEFTENRVFKAMFHNETDYLISVLGLMHLSNPTGLPSRGATNWAKLESLIDHLNPNISITYKFGYYSSHAVCLPTFFPDLEVDKAWGYTVYLLLVNFTAFLFMLLAYIVLYNRATNVQEVVQLKNSLQEKRESQNKKMQRKLTRIVFSDFLCWMPICFLGMMKVAGMTISNDVYIPSALIIVPINSALNPFLYSDLPDMIYGKIKRVFCRSPCTLTTSEDFETPEDMKKH